MLPLKVFIVKWILILACVSHVWLHSYILYIDNCNCDSNWSGAIIGAVVEVDCVVIIIMVITNIMVWIYCFRDTIQVHSYIFVFHVCYVYCYCVYICTVPGLKLGHFFQGQAGLCFIKYLDLTQIDCTIRVFRLFGVYIRNTTVEIIELPAIFISLYKV